MTERRPATRSRRVRFGRGKGMEAVRFIRRNLPAIISLTLLAASVAYIGLRQNLVSSVLAAWGRIDAPHIFGAIAFNLLVQCAVAWRCSVIYRGDGLRSRRMFLPNLRIQLVTLFAGHCAIVPGFAEVAKGTLVKLRFDIAVVRAMKLIIYERVCSAVGYMMIGLLVLPLAFAYDVPTWLIVAPLTAWLGCLAILAMLMIMAKRPTSTRFGKFDRYITAFVRIGDLYHDRRSFADLFLCALLQTSLVSISFVLLARGMSLSIAPGIIFLFMPFILFISSIPIFYMGWGGREAAVIMTLGAVGHIPTTDSLALSAAYGVVVLLSALPGAGFWLLRPSMRKTRFDPSLILAADADQTSA
jgi:Lysylphosphatidylglycerol synthase TM region